MEIGSGQQYPASALSNFSPHPFEIDGVKCSSMEGFLQSLKFRDEPMQVHVCTLVGKAAKFKGKGKKWWRTQKLYWKGMEIDRSSELYQGLLDRAFLAMYEQCESFRNALIASAGSTFKHSIGKRDKKETVLTIQEFTSRLNFLRDKALGIVQKDAEESVSSSGEWVPKSSKSVMATMLMANAMLSVRGREW